MIERASRVTTQELVRTRLLEPLGMTSTTWTRPDGGPVAEPYRWVDDGWRHDGEPVGDGAIAPMGGLWSTVRDLATWIGFSGQQIDGAGRFPSQMAVASSVNRDSSEDIEMLKKAVSAVAAAAMDIGINMPLIPVLDVNRNPDNPIICTRAFSDDPEIVAWFGRLYIRTLEDAGLISCAKHFPGHGDTDIDSHISLPVINKTLKDLMDIDIYPFMEAIKENVSSIMAGHLSIPALDTLPASLSEKVITGLLRKELGYEGLIMTDALNMHAF